MKLSIILLAIVTCFSCKKDVDLFDYSKETIQYKTLSNTKNNLLSLDVFFKNKTESKPVVIYVHGGGWAIGDKTNSMENKLRFFNDLDYVLVSVNYRLSPFPYNTKDKERVKYPDHNNDVADAIKWIYDNIENYGGNKNKMALFGHSAGAQIVALTGTDKYFLESRGLSLSVLKGIGIIDTRGFDIPFMVSDDSDTQPMYINAFGVDVQENIKASPIRILESGIEYPKVFITLRGSDQRKSNINDFIDKMNSFEMDVKVVDGSEYNHSEINNAIGEKGETIISTPLKQFFKDCFN